MRTTVDIEEDVLQAAKALARMRSMRFGIDPAELRRRNDYGAAPRNRTPYDQPVEPGR